MLGMDIAYLGYMKQEFTVFKIKESMINSPQHSPFNTAEMPM